MSDPSKPAAPQSGTALLARMALELIGPRSLHMKSFEAGQVIDWLKTISNWKPETSNLPAPAAPQPVDDLESFRLVAREGDRVRYVPGHAHGDANHKDCEDGTITSFGDSNVRVRFDKSVARLGWDGATSQACYVSDLRIL